MLPNKTQNSEKRLTPVREGVGMDYFAPFILKNIPTQPSLSKSAFQIICAGRGGGVVCGEDLSDLMPS